MLIVYYFFLRWYFVEGSNVYMIEKFKLVIYILGLLNGIKVVCFLEGRGRGILILKGLKYVVFGFWK